MNEQEKQILRTAAERLLAVADGKTLELTNGAAIAIDGGAQIGVIGGQFVRIRPPAAPHEPKPSQAVFDACKRLGVEAWKLDVFKPGDTLLLGGHVTPAGVDNYTFAPQMYVSTIMPHITPNGCRYWHVRPIAQAKPPVVTPWALDPVHAGKVVVRNDGKGWGMIVGTSYEAFYVGGQGYIPAAQLLRDWTHNGQPCGEVAK